MWAFIPMKTSSSIVTSCGNVGSIQAPAENVDNFLEEVLEGIFGRFFITHRPWR